MRLYFLILMHPCMDKVLVTGGKGQLGQSLEKLVGFYPQWQFFFPDKAIVDITQPQDLENFITQHAITAIINTAAYTQVDQAEKDPEQAFAVNENGVANLIFAAEKYNLKLISFSTDYVFGSQKKGTYSESDIITPFGVYAQSKAKAEALLLNAKKPMVIVRTAWVFSLYGKNFVKTIRKLGLQKEELQVVNDQWGSPTYAKDLAVVSLKILEKYPKQTEIFHMVNTGTTNWFEFAREIIILSKIQTQLLPVPTTAYPTLAIRPQKAILQTEKIQSYLGINIRSWQDALAECIHQMNKNE